MSWKQQLFKAKWQHKDPAVRRNAVSSMQDPGLLEALPAICLEDEDPEVRSAAAHTAIQVPADAQHPQRRKYMPY